VRIGENGSMARKRFAQLWQALARAGNTESVVRM
jgi:hypothetical protein